MKLKSLVVGTMLGAAALTAITSNSAMAQHAFNDAEKAVEYRQKALSIMQNNFALMGDMVKGDIEFDGEIFKDRASDFAVLSAIPWVGFSQPGAMPGDDTDALPAIWDNWDDFMQRSEQLQKDAAALAAAAESGDQSSIRSAFLATAKSCKGCHDNYKD